jgi:lipoprotein-anchoring transpeptidase ErfK/SrfK
MSVRATYVTLRLAMPLLALPLLVAACASVTSATSIGPGAAFRLGGGQAGAFVVRGTNTGPVPVVVFSERAGRRDSIAPWRPARPWTPGSRRTATAVFQNTSSTQTATVVITVTGDVGALGMVYEPNPER